MHGILCRVVSKGVGTIKTHDGMATSLVVNAACDWIVCGNTRAVSLAVVERVVVVAFMPVGTIKK